MRTFGILPVGRADEDFTVALAGFAMKFVDWHKGKIIGPAEISRGEFFAVRQVVAVSSGLRLHRWCLQKEIAASAIRRDHRKTPRWLCLDDAKTRIRFFPNNINGFRARTPCYSSKLSPTAIMSLGLATSDSMIGVYKADEPKI